MTRRHDESGTVGGHVSDLLSAYIDNRLSAAEHDSVRRHLQTCVDCRGDYIELRATQQMLRSMPTAVPPRAFTLTPEMARQARPARLGWLARLLAPNNASRYALGSVMSFALLALIFVGTLLGGRAEFNADMNTAASAPIQAPAPDVLQKSAAAQGTAAARAFDSSSGGAAAAPTSTTAAAGSVASGGAQAEATTPSQQLEVGPATPALGIAAAPPAEGTPLPSADSGLPGATSAQAADTPPSILSTGGTSSPSTNAYESAPPNASRVAGQGGSSGEQVAALPLLEIGLLALGLLFAAGALLARRGA